MLRRILLASLLVIASAGVPALSQEPNMKVEAHGPDGKPVTKGTVMTIPFGDIAPKNKLTPGELVTVVVQDDQGNGGAKMVEVPKSGTLVVSIDLAPSKSTDTFFGLYQKAEKASADGDFETYTKYAIEAKEDVDRRSEGVAQEEKAVDEWAEHNDLPVLTSSQLDDAIERAKANGLTKKNSTAFRLLDQYRRYRRAVELHRAAVDYNDGQLKNLKTPEKQASMAPGTCPEGQGGGLLASWLNSATGSDLAAVCDIDVKREKDKHNSRGHAEHRDDHGRD
ncbi:MAG: hypothetical protein R3D05_10270 [Dongiaceae bacterium]